MGKRNYRFFYAFILSLSFLTAFIFACVVTHLVRVGVGWGCVGGPGASSASSRGRGHRPSICALSCLFLPRLSGKQLPLHSEGDTSEISFCQQGGALVGPKAPSLRRVPAGPVNRGQWVRADVCPLESSMPAAPVHPQATAHSEWAVVGPGLPRTPRSTDPLRHSALWTVPCP